jgi:uncharacterized protein YbbC (DUF1343 family)
VKPQPKIKSLRTNLAYVGFGLLEGTNLNDGRGTSRPYMRAGAPWLSGSHLVEKLTALNLPGVEFRIVEYIPRKRPEDRMVPMHVNKVCSGVDIYITDANRYDPLATATAIMVLAYQLYPRQFQWDGLNRIDMLYGHSQLRIFAAQGKPANYLPPLWLKDVLKFNEFRQQFLLYQ